MFVCLYGQTNFCKTMKVSFLLMNYFVIQQRIQKPSLSSILIFI